MILSLSLRHASAFLHKGKKDRSVDQNQIINKSIAAISRRIPYIPELKAYCKTTNACLLMVQLEFRFAAKPDGFYKFLSPCDHSLYKKGDSWTEELAFSTTEIRNAFENIGERYSSYKKISEIIGKGADPFNEKYYLSYRDIRNGLTFYLRNHELTNQLVMQVTTNFDSGFTQVPPNESEFPELNNVEFRNLTNSSSGSEQSSFPIKGIQKSTAKEKAASKQKPAALIFTDVLIGEALTKQQLDQVEMLISELLEAKIQGFDEAGEQLKQGICYELLDKNSFKKCQQEFLRKLKAIKNEIIKGRWSIPASLLKAKQETFSQEQQSLETNIREAILEKNHWERMKNQHSQKGVPEMIEQCEKEIVRAKTLVEQYRRELRQLTNH